MLFGSFGTDGSDKWSERSAIVFDSKDFKWSDDNKDGKQYTVVFGSSTVDLTDLSANGSNDNRIEVHTVFGETKVLLSKKSSFRIRANSVFGEARIPNENMVAFGSLNYENKGEKETPTWIIHGNVVFGSLKFQYKD